MPLHQSQIQFGVEHEHSPSRNSQQTEQNLKRREDRSLNRITDPLLRTRLQEAGNAIALWVLMENPIPTAEELDQKVTNELYPISQDHGGAERYRTAVHEHAYSARSALIRNLRVHQCEERSHEMRRTFQEQEV